MIEKKLILCGILAIAIGIASIVPLEFFMSGGAQASTSQENPWFNLSVPYAYWIADTTTKPGNTTFAEAYYVELKVTTNADAIKTLPNSRIEFYQIQVYSDQGSIQNWTYFIGANCTGSINPYNTWLNGLQTYFNNNNTLTTGSQAITQQQYFNNSFPTYNYFLFLPNFNGKLATPAKSDIHENYTVFALQGINMTSSWIDIQREQTGNIENAHTISIDIRRLGYITIEANSTITTPADNTIIQHIELTPYNGGFLYNTMIPQDQLSQTNLGSPFNTQTKP